MTGPGIDEPRGETASAADVADGSRDERPRDRRPWPYLVDAFAVALFALLVVGSLRERALAAAPIDLALAQHLSGLLALALLISSAASSALSRFVARASLRARRRVHGMAAFVVALVHASLGLLRAGGSISSLLALPFVRHGALALGVLAILFATSFPRWNARAGLRDFDGLHVLAHVAIPLVALHVALATHGDPRVVLGWLVLWAGTWIARRVAT